MTAISVVGVEAIPASMTSAPQAVSVPVTRASTISPDILASRPTTILGLRPFTVADTCCAYAVVNLTMSMGVRASPGFPPTVPLIPDIDTISDIQFPVLILQIYKKMLFPNSKHLADAISV